MNIYRKLHTDLQGVVFSKLNNGYHAGHSYQETIDGNREVLIDGWDFWCHADNDTLAEIKNVFDAGLVKKARIICSYDMKYITSELRDEEVQWVTATLPASKVELQYDWSYFNDV